MNTSIITMPDTQPHEKRFHGSPDFLRSPERLARLEVERVVALALEEALRRPAATP